MLLRGPSGAGKSDLALRAVAAGWRLVADDRVLAWRSGGRLWGRAPDVLHGLCEMRGQAVARLPALAFAPVDLVAELAAPGAAMERMPEPAQAWLEGVAVPSLALRANEASALARLEFALEALASHAATAHV